MSRNIAIVYFANPLKPACAVKNLDIGESIAYDPQHFTIFGKFQEC